MFRFIGGLITVNRLKYRQTIPLEDEWLEKINCYIERLKIRREIVVLQSFLIEIPATLGFLKPVILLPVSLFSGLSTSQIESIIAHELAHIQRRDYLLNIFQSVIEILFFYHPAVWWISSVARTERENCCDDIAVEITGDKISYAKALANIRTESPESSYAMAFSGNKNKLFKRVKRLLNPHPMKTNFKEGFITSCILFTGIILLTIGATASVNEFNIAPTSKDTTKKELKNVEPFTKNELTVKEKEKIKKENKEMFQELNNLGNLSENLEKELEVAFGDLDELSTNEVLKGIKGAMKEMDLNLIVNEALKGAKAALNNMDINTIVKESIQNEQNEQQNEIIIAQEAVKGAQAALEEMDLNLIVNEALKGVEGALKEMDLDNIVEKSLENELKENTTTEEKENKIFYLK
ncbi:MAG: M56 family metallopeptidase [Bacteroidales bacterium]|nr:M56 family metallopeptidase [Bacteroidales bacterium]